MVKIDHKVDYFYINHIILSRHFTVKLQNK